MKCAYSAVSRSFIRIPTNTPFLSRPYEQFHPSIEVLHAVLQCLPKYGIPIPDADAELWTLVANHAPAHPLQVYLIGAKYSIESVCVVASPYTLDMSLLQTLVDLDAVGMGPVYLNRLFLLHTERAEALKTILLAPPVEHPLCVVTEPESVSAAWRVAIGRLLLRTQVQATSVEASTEAIEGIVSATQCGECQVRITMRMVEVTQAWLAVRRSI